MPPTNSCRPSKAFQVSARAVGDRSVEVSFKAAPGYYLYREQFKFAATGATLGTPALPPGKVKFDETFQKDVETYRDIVARRHPGGEGGARVPPRRHQPGLRRRGPVLSAAAERLQGQPRRLRRQRHGACAGGGRRRRHEPAVGGVAAAASPGGAAAGDASADASALGSTLREGRFWPVVGVFFVAGLLLSLTPCVLPMLPIVSSIIAGQGTTVSRGRGLALAAAYSLGMALVYTALGVAAGLAGEGLAAALQTPWVLGAFAVAPGRARAVDVRRLRAAAARRLHEPA